MPSGLRRWGALSPQTNSKANYPPAAPTMALEARGAWVKGQRRSGEERWYVDCVNGMGAVILGHCHPAVDAAIQAQLRLGISFPLESPIEQKVAERLLSLLTWKGAEFVRFAKNGADVTGAAVRIARAVTGRDMIAYNGFHGHHDWSMGRPPKNAGVPSEMRALSNQIQEPLLAMQLDSIEEELHTGLYAAYVIEPIVSARPLIPSAEFFKKVRAICDRTATLLIADECVTGFRVALGGACELYGIEPDLACYGKALANGMPLSALVGSEYLMKQITEGDVFFSTTHGGEALSLAAALATLTVLGECNVPERLGELGRAIMANSGTGVSGYPQRPILPFREEQLNVLFQDGVLCQGYVNISLAHCEDENARSTLITAVRMAAELEKEAGVR